MNLIQEFKRRADADGIPCFTNAEWKEFRSKYEKDELKTRLADYICMHKVKFPFKKATQLQIKELFLKFYNTSHIDWLMNVAPNDVSEKFDYKYKYADKPLGVIDKSHYYNLCADFFQQENRMACGSDSSPAPLEIWNDFEKLRKMNWHFWRDGALENSDINPGTFRSAFRLGTYTATQFKPSVAKFLYEYHNAETILDTSCGWGDRLCGFYGTPNTQLYVGCDPNPLVWEVYKEQCAAYEQWLGGVPKFTITDNYFKCEGIKTVEIWRKPAEDVDWSLYENTFDLYFTSPPYFETEKYATGSGAEDDQSWNRYPDFQSWRDKFFFHVTEQVWKTIKKDGYMMINIIEPSSKGKRHALCDSMVEFCEQLPDCHYVGKLGMRMMGRPHTADVNGVLIEPIWTFMKGQTEYAAKAGLEAFM